jgi:uncharacterized protein (DUF302 family)
MMMKSLLLATGLVAVALPALAGGVVTYTTDETFDDVTFSVESAITDAGLKIDSTSHVGEMLERTKGDVGSDVTIFTGANVYNFCSARVSRAVMEADPMNLQFCPYGIFVMVTPDKPDETTVGYRSFPEGPMKQVEEMLEGIVKEALGE